MGYGPLHRLSRPLDQICRAALESVFGSFKARENSGEEGNEMLQYVGGWTVSCQRNQLQQIHSKTVQDMSAVSWICKPSFKPLIQTWRAEKYLQQLQHYDRDSVSCCKLRLSSALDWTNVQQCLTTLGWIRKGDIDSHELA